MYAIQIRNSNPNFEFQRGLLIIKMFLFCFGKHGYIKLSLFAIISLINIIPIDNYRYREIYAKNSYFFKCLKLNTFLLLRPAQNITC